MDTGAGGRRQVAVSGGQLSLGSPAGGGGEGDKEFPLFVVVPTGG